MFDSKRFNSAMGTVIKLAKDTLTCFSAKPSIFHMAQAMTTILMSMCTNHIHMDIKIAVVACAIWKMEGLAEKQVSVFGQFYDSPHGRVEIFTVKHYCEMNEHNIFYFKMEYIMLFGTPISQKCLTVNFLLLCHAR